MERLQYCNRLSKYFFEHLQYYYCFKNLIVKQFRCGIEFLSNWTSKFKIEFEFGKIVKRDSLWIL